MQKTKTIFFFLWIILCSLLITYYWFNNIYTINFSQIIWSFYNNLFGGQKPSLATDLEFLTIIFISFFMTYILSHLLKKSWIFLKLKLSIKTNE